MVHDAVQPPWLLTRLRSLAACPSWPGGTVFCQTKVRKKAGRLTGLRCAVHHKAPTHRLSDSQSPDSPTHRLSDSQSLDSSSHGLDDYFPGRVLKTISKHSTMSSRATAGSRGISPWRSSKADPARFLRSLRSVGMTRRGF